MPESMMVEPVSPSADAPSPKPPVTQLPQPSVTMVLAAFAVVYLVWGSTYLGIRFAVETIPPFLMTGTRFILSGLGLYAIARCTTRERTT